MDSGAGISNKDEEFDLTEEFNNLPVDRFHKKEPIAKGIPITEQDLADAEASVKKVTALSETDLDNLTADGPKKSYLYDIFGAEFDKYKSLFHVKQTREDYLKKGYPPGPTLDMFIFMSAVSRRYQILYQRRHKQLSEAKDSRPEDFKVIKEIENIAEKMARLQIALDEQREKLHAGLDIQHLHQREIEENSKFIQEHIGEFSFRCQKCSAIVSSGGIPHWGIHYIKKGNEVGYHIWNPQMALAIKKGLLKPYLMAFFLDTSIEGLLFTAEERGEKLPDFDIKSEEERLKELLSEFET